MISFLIWDYTDLIRLVNNAGVPGTTTEMLAEPYGCGRSRQGELSTSGAMTVATTGTI